MVWNYTAKLQKGRLCHHPSSYRCLGCRLTLPRSGPWNIHTTVFSIPQSQKQTKCSRRERKCSLLGGHMAINCNKKNWQLQAVKWLSLTVLSEEKEKSTECIHLHRVQISQNEPYYFLICVQRQTVRGLESRSEGATSVPGVTYVVVTPMDTWELSLMCYVAQVSFIYILFKTFPKE